MFFPVPSRRVWGRCGALRSLGESCLLCPLSSLTLGRNWIPLSLTDPSPLRPQWARSVSPSQMHPAQSWCSACQEAEASVSFLPRRGGGLWARRVEVDWGGPKRSRKGLGWSCLEGMEAQIWLGVQGWAGHLPDPPFRLETQWAPPSSLVLRASFGQDSCGCKT